MASGTLKYKFSIDYKTTKASLLENFGTTEIEVVGVDYFFGTQTIGTSEEALVRGDTGVNARMVIKNLDDTNHVSFRSATGLTNAFKIDPGEFAVFRLEAAAPFMIANTAPVLVAVWAFDS